MPRNYILYIDSFEEFLCSHFSFLNSMSVPTKSSKDDAESQFAPGDNVEVVEGELINLQGKIVSVEGNKIVMLPFHEDLKVIN